MVGAPRDDYNGFYDVGSVYVFVRNGVTWTHQAKLEAPDPASEKGFGKGDAIHAGTSLVGSESGETYAFTG